jgi:hypothetical protein
MKTIIILTVIGMVGGETHSYAVKAESLDACYDMVNIEMQREKPVKVLYAVCNQVKWVE